MINFPTDLNVIDINPEAQEVELVAIFEDDLKKKLYPAQPERISISIINKVSTLLKMQFNKAIKNLLLPYAEEIWLDFIGAILSTPRLPASPANTTLKFKLYQPFLIPKTILKGTQIETSDGEYIFTTDADLVIPAGEISGTVGATSVLGGALLNNYKSGDITGLLDNLAYIETVTNIDDANGGEDEEGDDHYRERLYLAPNGWSNAGPIGAYKFFAMSASKDIIDVAVITPAPPASITIGENIYVEGNGNINCGGVICPVDYYNGRITFPTPVAINAIEIPPANKVNLYLLTGSGKVSKNLIDNVLKKVNAEAIRPTTDLVQAFEAISETFIVSPTVYPKDDAPADLEASVSAALNAYFLTLQKKFKQSVYRSDIYSVIEAVEGVDGVDLPQDFVNKPSVANKYYAGQIGTIKIQGGAQ